MPLAPSRFLGDQELKLEKRNEKFLLTWHQRLASAENDRQEAEAAVELARRMCEDADVSIPPWAETNSAFSEMYQRYPDAAQLATAGSSESIMFQPGHVVGSSTNSSGPVVVDASSPLFNTLKNRPLADDKITKWIEGVPDVAGSASGLSAVPTHDSSNAISSDFHHVEATRRVRSLSYLPSVTRLGPTRKSPASCPSSLDTSRSPE
jgi:hypothetical protein